VDPESGGGLVVKRTILLLATVLAMVALAAVVAGAGTDRADTITGTNENDVIFGKGGADR
jgi:Ca2+-binding RTX toxin-like protein